MATPNPSDGNVFYLRPGITYPQEPTPGHVGSWHFPTFGAGGEGTVDSMGTCCLNIVRCCVVGEGTLVVHTADTGGTVNLIATLNHSEPSDPNGVVVEETQTGEAGDDFTFEITTHAGVNCTHWVDVTDQGPCGTGWGFTGADWTAAE